MFQALWLGQKPWNSWEITWPQPHLVLMMRTWNSWISCQSFPFHILMSKSRGWTSGELIAKSKNSNLLIRIKRFWEIESPANKLSSSRSPRWTSSKSWNGSTCQRFWGVFGLFDVQVHLELFALLVQVQILPLQLVHFFAHFLQLLLQSFQLENLKMITNCNFRLTLHFYLCPNHVVFGIETFLGFLLFIQITAKISHLWK